jgi:hypothetical protein
MVAVGYQIHHFLKTGGLRVLTDRFSWLDFNNVSRFLRCVILALVILGFYIRFFYIRFSLFAPCTPILE